MFKLIGCLIVLLPATGALAQSVQQQLDDIQFQMQLQNLAADDQQRQTNKTDPGNGPASVQDEIRKPLQLPDPGSCRKSDRFGVCTR